MTVASFELSSQLYDLTGWQATDTDYAYSVWGDSEPQLTTLRELYRFDGTINEDLAYILAYDLGYLLRKLPHHIGGSQLTLCPDKDGTWSIAYFKHDRAFKLLTANTPEDCAIKLLIALIEEGVLKP
jgi:hypothetical protein